MSTVPFNSGRKYPLPAEILKKLPHNRDAERAVLGTILLDNQALKVACAETSMEDFFLPEHRVIFQSMAKMEANDQQVIDILTLSDELSRERLLEAAGGPGYLASLVDGIPKISNVKYYAGIVREDAKRRRLIYEMYRIEQLAYEENVEPEELLSQINAFLKQQETNKGEKLIAVDVRDFLTMNLLPKEYVIMPILPVRNSGMIYAPTGAGKTYIMLHLAYCVAIGFPSVFVWDIPKQRRVVYVEGEMDSQDLQERVQDISRGFEGVFPEAGQLRIIASDLPGQTAIPRINTSEGRKRIEEHLSGDELLILDNLTALCPSAEEEESGEWSLVQEWILSLRRRGIGIFLVHHPGKSGSQLGTSRKEFQLSCNLHVKLPSNYDLAEGLRVEMKLDKLRSRGTGEFKPKWTQPFEISLRTEGDKEHKAAIFSHRPLRELLRQRAFEMLQAGMRENDVAQETGLDRFAIYRIKQKMKLGTPINED